MPVADISHNPLDTWNNLLFGPCHSFHHRKLEQRSCVIQYLASVTGFCKQSSKHFLQCVFAFVYLHFCFH